MIYLSLYSGTSWHSLIIACSSNAPMINEDVLVIIKDSSTKDDINVCRSTCIQNKHNIVIFKQYEICYCIDISIFFDWLNAEKSWQTSNCSGNEAYLALWATHNLWSDVDPINLSVDVRSISMKSYGNPNQTVLFYMTKSTPNFVTFLIDFDDGYDVQTSEMIVEHVWKNAGLYNVNITASTRNARETSIVPVNITFVQNRLPPINMIIKADAEMGLNTSGIVNVFVSAYSEDIMTCDVLISENNTKLHKDNLQFAYAEDMTIKFHETGYYIVTFICENDIGSQSTTQLAKAVNPRLLYESFNFSSSVNFDFIGGNSSNIQLFVDGVFQMNGIDFTTRNITIDRRIFKTVGEHSVVLKSPLGFPFIQKIVNVIKPIRNVSFTASNISSQINQIITFSIGIVDGDEIYLEVSYGDGISELFYIPSVNTPMTIVRNHAFTKLGKYDLMIFFANEISQQVLYQSVSIERPIESAVMTYTNVTILGQPTTFTFVIDSDKTPVVPVQLNINYGDGNESNVLMEPSMKSFAFNHTYIYRKYGIYRVSVELKNNISSLRLPFAFVQIGQNITQIDIYAVNNVIGVGQDISLKVDCPRGSPVSLEIDMGDGLSILKMIRPLSYNDRDNVITNSSVLSKVKRSINDLQDSNIFDPFYINYKYKSSGRFTVKAVARNIFSEAVSFLCPDITVVDNKVNSQALTCSRVGVSIVSASTLSKPVISQRSSDLVFIAHPEITCSGIYKPSYQWSAERLMTDNSWRPELQVCATDVPDTTYTVLKNTLWYGIYRINVSFILNTTIANSMVSTLIKPEQPASTYVSIIPSPLIASISHESKDYYSVWDTINLNLTDSYDPDTVNSNHTGMNFSLFCYTHSKYSNLTLDEMISQAQSVAENSYKDATFYQFEDQPCLATKNNNIWVMEFEIVFPAKDFLVQDSVQFSLFVTKDTRIAKTTIDFDILTTNLTASALDNIDELLKTNVNSALLVLNMVTGSLNDDSSNSEVRY